MKPKPSRRSNRLAVLSLTVCLAATWCPADIGPIVTATQRDSLAVDTNVNSRADSGDVLEYTVVLTNSGVISASNVWFAETLDPNTTYLNGTLMTTPLAIDDAYAALGNVQISIPAPGVLDNDVDPDGVGPALAVASYNNSSANGGDVVMNGDGSFAYDPPAGFQGVDTFTYTLTDGEGNQDTATVSLTVSGLIWFVNAAAAPGGDGRLTAPFNRLTGAGSFAAVAADSPGDSIFVYSGSYAGGLSLLNSQMLIGQGAGASLSAITGLTPPTGSLPLPATGGARPTLAAAANNITLASGNLLRGLNLSSAGSTALLGASVGTLTVSEMSVTNTAGVGVNLANGSLAVTLTTLTANGGANGLKLVNTVGSFTVTGTGPANSGGTIQGTTGGDGSADGNGVYLDNVSNVALNSMSIHDHSNFAIRGVLVNGFSLRNCTVNGANGTSAAADEGSLSFAGLTGSAIIDGCNISGGLEDNVRISNTAGTLNRLTLLNSTIGANDTVLGNDGVLVEASGSATLNVTVTNCTFTSARGDLLQLNAANTAVMDWVVVSNSFANNHPNIVSGGGGATFSGGGGGSAVHVTYEISGNSFRDAKGIALNVSKGTGAGTFMGTIMNNVIGVSGLTDSGSSQASGIQVRASGGGAHSSQVVNNTIYQFNENGIYVRADDGDSALNVLLYNNTVTEPGAFALNGLQLNIGATVSDTSTACVDIQNNNLVGSGLPFDDDFNLRQRHGTTVRLPGYLGTPADTAAVVSFVQGNNTGVPSGVATVSGSGGGFVGGGSCIPALLAVPAPPESGEEWGEGVTAPLPVVQPGPTPTAQAMTPSALTEANLRATVAAAKQRWLALGLDAEQRAKLNRVTFRVADLCERQLGAVSEDHVTLDRQGVDRGWFIDATPMDEAEFPVEASGMRLNTGPAAGPAGRYDLLTAVLHEMGHAVGLPDSYTLEARESLMYGYLPLGERRLPTRELLTQTVAGQVHETHYLGAPISIGELPPGKSIIITFQAVIDPPPPGGLCEVSNQGSVSGDNFPAVLTDDPDTGILDDPTVTVVNRPDVPVITPNPATVEPDSTGNQASGPVGLTAYAWTVSNGTLTSAANLQTITYTAGAAGDVTLGLTVFNSGGCTASNSIEVPISSPAPGCPFPTNVVVDMTFQYGLDPSPIGLAFDGSNYWGVSGGGTTGNRLARYDASGTLLNTYAPGLDFRSIFTSADGTVFARAYNSPVIYRQTSPGVFIDSGVSLTGGTLDYQSSVVLDGTGTEYIAMSGGTVSRWDLSGNHIGDVSLQGYGSVGDEGNFPQNRGIAAAGAYWLTHNGDQSVSIWDTSGNRLAQITLTGAAVGFDPSLSLSYCNRKVFVADAAGDTWQGFDVFAPVRFAVLAAEGNVSWREDVRIKLLGTGTILDVDIIPVLAAPVPSLADLSRYRSVLVFSDTGFYDGVALGDVLADYVDQGGGVAMATFAYHDQISLGIKGRLKTGGYLPFSTADQASPGGLSLVKVLPEHPLLHQVASFNGGTSSYQNSPIAITNGATLVASWSNGQPLVGAKQSGPGRVVGLNFFPPSSDERSDFWDASTDGAQLLVNALLWAGQHPPVIVDGPADRVAVVGETVTFDVSVTGSAPLSFQWRKDGANLSGETSTNLSFVAQLSSAGEYSIAVSNLCGGVISSNATLTVLPSTNLVVTALDRGWYDATGYHSPGNLNYFVGNYPSDPYYRNWFVFDVPSLAAPIARAELRIHTFTIVSPTGSETYELHEVTTPTATVQAGGSGLINVYEDLGDGPVYAARTFVPAETGRNVSILLNQTLRNAVTAAAGGTFAMGGQLTSLDADPGTEEAVFSSSGDGLLELVLTVGTGDQPLAGYFTDNDPTQTGPEGPILNAGFTPLHIADITTQDFSGLRVLLINEESNVSVSAGLTSRLADIEAWVRSGGRLIIHDRSAGNLAPNPFLLGTPGLGTVRLETANLDLVDPATTLVTAGPFGIVSDTSLDGGSSSAHGYVPTAALPPGARAILSIAPDQIACFSYPLDAGFIYYSTIPLDCYLLGSGCEGNVIAPALTDVYTPNVISYMQERYSPLRFLTPDPLSGGTLPLFLVNSDGTPVSALRLPQIQVYASTNLTLPLGSWTPLANPLVLTNGQVRIDGLNVTDSPGTFFQAVELP